MRNRLTTLATVAMLAMWQAGCVSVQAPNVSETRAAVCPRPMTAAELRRAADAIDALPRGADLDFLAVQLERLDDGARICRGR